MDTLFEEKERAAALKTTAGKVISDIVQRALTGRVDVDRLPLRNGFPVLPSTGKVITVELIEKLLEEEI